MPTNREVRELWSELRQSEERREAGGKALLAKMGAAGGRGGLYKGIHLKPRRRSTRPSRLEPSTKLLGASWNLLGPF